MEHELMGTDAWNENLVLDELPRPDRIWWAAYDEEGRLIGYAGALVVEGDMQILKIGTARDHQREGIATELLAHVAEDARALGAEKASLEVRVGNTGAIRFYENLDFHSLGRRPRYYSDKEDAFILEGPLPLAREAHAVGGMEIKHIEATAEAEDQAQPAKPLLLAIESSCDETAAAVVDGCGKLHSDVVASQIDFHARFGGVVPEIASRKHIEAICGVVQEGLDAAAASLGVPKLHLRDLDGIAATYAPGLVGALVVGVAFAKGAAWGADIPFIGVNHLEGHLFANKIATPDIQPPMVVSLVSGGHTMLVHVRDWGDYETLGSTIDDAVGEAFDKVAKALGLGYPGGPVISKLAAQGNPKAVRFPRAMMHSGDLRFSLSGLKTSVITYIQKERAAGRELNLPDIAASFQQAVIDVQVAKARTALRDTGAREFCLGGGVAANPALRKAYEDMCRVEGVRLTMPPLSSCTDNAGMISLVALHRFQKGKTFTLDADVKAHAPLDEAY
jgi:N6-L-threonylcarbamoyladenine synthase